MPANAVTCPNCGAPLPANPASGARRCAYCGTQLQLSSPAPADAPRLHAKQVRLDWLYAHPPDAALNRVRLQSIDEELAAVRKGQTRGGCCIVGLLAPFIAVLLLLAPIGSGFFAGRPNFWALLFFLGLAGFLGLTGVVAVVAARVNAQRAEKPLLAEQGRLLVAEKEHAAEVEQLERELGQGNGWDADARRAAARASKRG